MCLVIFPEKIGPLSKGFLSKPAKIYGQRIFPPKKFVRFLAFQSILAALSNPQSWIKVAATEEVKT